MISCYVDANFALGELADFSATQPGPATEAAPCGTHVALDEMALLSYHGDRWTAASFAGGWSEMLNAKSRAGRRFLVLQLAVTDGSRVEGTLVMTLSSQAADTVTKSFCCGCERAAAEQEL